MKLKKPNYLCTNYPPDVTLLSTMKIYALITCILYIAIIDFEKYKGKQQNKPFQDFSKKYS